MDQNEIRNKVRERVELEAAKFKNESRRDEEITPQFIQRCLQANEAGDGILYTAMHRGKYVYNSTSSDWLKWTGHHWERDTIPMALAAVEHVAVRYLNEAQAVQNEIHKMQKANNTDTKGLEKKRDILYKRASKLRTENGRQNCFKFAKINLNGLSVTGEFFDQAPWLLPCANGVIDLKSGAFHPGSPGDYLTKASPHEWKGLDEPAPMWEKCLYEIFSERQELVDFVRRVLGYAMAGLSKKHIFIVFHGQGRNGKGLIVETVKYVLDSLVGIIQSEMLLDSGRSKNSAGPSPDIMALKGVRVAFGSETDQGRRFSPSKVKWLSGGDTLVGRNAYDKHQTEFTPTHTLFLLTNHKPHAPADDFAFWERVCLVPFELSFVDRKPQTENERRVDEDLPEKLRAEASGILAWLVRGCLEWQEKGLETPQEVTEATKEYQRDEDILGDFIEECLEIGSEFESMAAEVYTRFQTWYEINVSKRVMKQRKFGSLLSKRFQKDKIGGRIKYFGFRVIPDQAAEAEPFS